jgi:hypothetical protein
MVDAMSTVKELVPRPDGIAAEPLLAGLDEVAADAEVDEDDEDAAADDEEEDVEEDEQPAATTAATAARATQPSRGRGLNAP